MFKSTTTKLFDAISAHDFDAFQKASRGYFDANKTNKEGKTLLHAWVKAGWRADNRFLDILVKAGADVNKPDSSGQTPLDFAMNAPTGALIASGSGEMRPKLKPSPDKVRALYERNAKAAKSDIIDIRKTMLGIHGNKHNYDETIARLEAQCYADRKEQKTVPPIDAPLFDNNRDDPYLHFAKAVNYVQIIASALSDRTQSVAFYNLIGSIREQSWEEFAKTIPEKPRETGQGVYDMMHDVTSKLVTPALMRGLGPRSLENIDEGMARYMADPLQHEPLINLITQGRRVEQIVELGQSYDKHVTAIHDKLHVHISDLEWETLSTAGKTFQPELRGLKGWSIVNLTNGKELTEEGRRMKHCVGGYADYCQQGKSHIFSVRNEKGESVSTFEVKPHKRPHQKTRYEINQHYAKGNTTPSGEAKRMVAWFEKAKDSRATPFRDEHKLGAKNKEEIDNLTPLERLSYHHQSDMTRERQQEIFDTLVGNGEDSTRIRSGRNTYLVPPRFRKMAVEDFIEEAGINNAIEAQSGQQYYSKVRLHYNPPKAPAPIQETAWQDKVSQEKATERGRA